MRDDRFFLKKLSKIVAGERIDDELETGRAYVRRCHDMGCVHVGPTVSIKDRVVVHPLSKFE